MTIGTTDIFKRRKNFKFVPGPHECLGKQ